MPTNENGVVNAICKAVAKKYPFAWFFKVVGSPYQKAGVPDLLFCVHGLFVGVEAKFARPGESHEGTLAKASPQQRVKIMRINRAGGIAGVAYTPAQPST